MQPINQVYSSCSGAIVAGANMPSGLALLGGCAGRGQFTAALEVQQQRRLCMSFLHHMAVQRLCNNPFEEKEVVGITNYLDFGLQVHTAVSPKYTNQGARLCAFVGRSRQSVADRLVRADCDRVDKGPERRRRQFTKFISSSQC